MSQAAWSIFVSAGTSTLLLGLATFALRAWAGARIKGEVDAVYARQLEAHRAELRVQTEKELESFRSQLERDRALHAAATSAFASANDAAAERKLHAVQEIWDATIRTKSAASEMMLLIDIFTREEVAAALDDTRRASSIGAPSDKEMMERFFPVGKAAEHVRPFIDEVLWAAFFGYRSLLGRILVVIQFGRNRGKLIYWLDDKYTRALLGSLVDASDLKRIEQMAVGGIAEAQRLIERRIIDAARRTVSGESAGAAALDHARLILERAQQMGAETQSLRSMS